MKRRKNSAKAFIKSLTKAEQDKLKNIELHTRQLMDKHGVSHYKFSFSRRRRTGGYCTATTISLNADYCLRAGCEDLYNTILHEIAHAMVGVAHGHRAVWQNKAQELGVTWKINYRK